MRTFALLLCLVATLALSCSQRKHSQSIRSLHSYNESPEFIRKFLDSVSAGNFRIAEKGSPWNGGCVLSGDLPCRQFVSASLNDKQYKLEFLTGGIMTSKQSVLIDFKNEKVLSYTLDVGQSIVQDQDQK